MTRTAPCDPPTCSDGFSAIDDLTSLAPTVTVAQAVDLYGGDWTLFGADWVNRADLIAAWFYDTGERRDEGLVYPYNLYDLSATVVAQDRGSQKLHFNDYDWFAFLIPFTPTLWASICIAGLVVAVVEKFVEGHLRNPFDVDEPPPPRGRNSSTRLLLTKEQVKRNSLPSPSPLSPTAP